MIGFFTDRRKSSEYQLWVCQLENALSPLLLFSVICESRQMEEKYIVSCDTISVEEHLCQNCWDPVSKSNNLEADLTILKRTGLFLVLPNIWHISLKIRGHSFHSEESFWCQDSQGVLQIMFGSNRDLLLK